ncbi:hypothetical protein O181_103994 [Austropuccinia psidii MF-1]|uniref:Uncharacterized protein n=1 Tax=Austropuccinia psidii MF-1 TaxID=1389203 RepID=A0A9Q3JMA6_9BASI|nr:hypothetical protein [Austropuccinia psidii MF-1]
MMVVQKAQLKVAYLKVDLGACDRRIKELGLLDSLIVIPENHSFPSLIFAAVNTSQVSHQSDPKSCHRIIIPKTQQTSHQGQKHSTVH